MLNTLSFQNFFKDLGASYKALAIGIIGGYIGTIIGLPLPWLLGSLGLNLCVAFTKFDIKFPTKLLNPIFLMIRRPPRSTRKESSAASDVYKRQIVIISFDL